MNRETNLRAGRIALPVIFLLVGVWVQVRAQNPAPQNPVEPAQTQTQTQANQAPDLAFLNLSPEQIQKIRSINAELRDQKQAANQKLRQAQRALAEAIESPTPNEALIEQRSHDVAEAQANTIRLRSLTEARILQVMTPEQRIRLREMRQRNQALRRQGNQQLPVNVLQQRRQGLPRNVNAQPGLGPNQRKQMRQQQKP
jgi:Spy/CpxP family protein refolding chaperone